MIQRVIIGKRDKERVDRYKCISIEKKSELERNITRAKKRKKEIDGNK